MSVLFPFGRPFSSFPYILLTLNLPDKEVLTLNLPDKEVIYFHNMVMFDKHLYR